MQLGHADEKDISHLKEMWCKIFGDSKEFADFAFTLCDKNDIFILRDNEDIAAMLMAGIEVFVDNKKGFYIYGVCTHESYRNKGYAKQLIEYSCKEKLTQGYTFAITQPATEELFGFYEKLGFNSKTYLRTFTTTIKRNLWARADFDIVTASRFKLIRDKFKEDEIVHFSPKGYEKLAENIYTSGGSTAETDKAYAVYFFDKDKLIVRELFAASTKDAQLLLEAISDRTGISTAQVSLSQNSNLFIGEGKLKPHCLVMGINKEIYANLMFD